MKLEIDLGEIGRRFQIEGDLVSGARFGSGHIHFTFVVVYSRGGAVTRYLHQRINDRVFPDPPALMENISRVLGHLRQKLPSDDRSAGLRLVPTLVPAHDGLPWARDDRGGWWRTWRYIEARTVDRVESPREAYQAARAFGLFQRHLLDLPGPPLHATIPRFHDTPARFETFRRALEADALERAGSMRVEVDFALERQALAHELETLRAQGLVPERTVHNDTKVNNVLFDVSTGEALAVVDLDTVMPGLGLHDFGDLVRTASCRVEEDATDPSRARVDPVLLEALSRGYLDALGDGITPAERESLVLAGKVIALECGLRFLTDYLEGDRYFRVQRAGQNRDRCRTQFAIVRSLEENEEDLRRLVERL